MMKFRLVAAALLAAGCPVPALAQGEADLSINAGVVSDYRYRGISLSGRDPAVQGGLDLESGPFFAGLWASTIADYEGAATEVDVYGGLQGSFGDTTLRGGAYAYLYPGGTGVDYVELVAGAERSFGHVTVGIEAALAPRQDNVPRANHYAGLSASYDRGAGWGLFARGGYEDGFYEGKWDWEVGGSYTTGPFTASLAYVDTNHGAADEAGELGRAGLVASLLANF